MDTTVESDVQNLALVALHWDEHRPQLRVREDGSHSTRLIDPVGLKLNYQVGANPVRWCVGRHEPGSGYVDCRTRLTEPGRTCARCQSAEAIFASQLHHAHTQPRRLSSEMGRHLQQENLLYVAGFRDGSVKIGTSTRARIQKRLLEQGAWMAIQVALSTDGYAVREVEDQITLDLQLPQAVQAGRKVSGLSSPMGDEVLRSKLAAHTTSVHRLLDERADARLHPRQDGWENPAVQDTRWTGLITYPLHLGRGSHDLVIDGLVGRSAALRRPGTNDVFVADLGKLFGLEVQLGDFTSDEIAIQTSLF